MFCIIAVGCYMFQISFLLSRYLTIQHKYCDMKGPSIENIMWTLFCVCKFEHILLTWNVTKVGSHNDPPSLFLFCNIIIKFNDPYIFI